MSDDTPTKSPEAASPGYALADIPLGMIPLPEDDASVESVLEMVLQVWKGEPLTISH